MRKMELIAPCHFGLEAVLRREITDLGYEISEVEDGRITFLGDEEAVCRANIFLRTAERVLIKVGSFHAETFEELFQGTKALEWENYIPADGKFWVAKAASVKSKLFSPSDIQSIMKKAMVERLKGVIQGQLVSGDWRTHIPVRVFLKKDEVNVGLDTTGESLHKRGYRKLTAKAPIAENLAAALIDADALESGSDFGRPVLRKRHDPYRSSDDGGEYGARYEPGVHRGRVGTFYRSQMLVSRIGRGAGSGRSGCKDGYSGLRY